MEALSAMLWAFARGLYDSVRGAFVLFQIDTKLKERIEEKNNSPRQRSHRSKSSPHRSLKNVEPKILRRTLQCCLLNGGVFWLSMVLFELALLPSLRLLLALTLGESTAMHSIWFWTSKLLSYTFSAIWILPLFLLTKIVNGLWFMDIAEDAFRFSQGRPVASSSVSRLIADNVFSYLVQILFLLQTMLVSCLPMPFALFSIVHLSMLYSLYSFESRWYNMGWELHRRLTFIENNWPYFIGFGLPLAIITTVPNNYIISNHLCQMKMERMGDIFWTDRYFGSLRQWQCS